MSFYSLLFFALFLFLGGIVVFSSNFLFPYHRIVAFTLHTMAWVLLWYGFSVRKSILLDQASHSVGTFFSQFWLHLVVLGFLSLVVYVFLVLFPLEQSGLARLSLSEREWVLQDDRQVIKYLDSRLEGLLSDAKTRDSFRSNVSLSTPQEKQELQEFFISYTQAMFELDVIKQRYKTFYQINQFTHRSQHAQAFTNGYLAFLTQHYYMAQLSEQVETNTSIQRYLDDVNSVSGIEKGTYSRLVTRLSDGKEILRLISGRQYYRWYGDKDSYVQERVANYRKFIRARVGSYIKAILLRPGDFFEAQSHRVWFPLQKNIAEDISYIKVHERDYYITTSQVDEFKEDLLPGDIFLERRAWHATNIGIPGYWTHAALYIGDLDYLNTYFADLDQLEGETFSHYLKEVYPEVYREMSVTVLGRDPVAVIESKRPGVIMTSLEETAFADSLAVLRTRDMNKAVAFDVVTQAMSHLGTPYDYDFDFTTDNAMVCSELVYKSYRGVTVFDLDLNIINGKPIATPNDIAVKFVNEYQTDRQQLDLVLFLDSSEQTKTSIQKDVEAFMTTPIRPKWYIAKDIFGYTD